MAQVILISYFHFFIHSLSILIIGIHIPFGEAHPKKHLKLKGGAMVWLRYSFSLFSFLPFIFYSFPVYFNYWYSYALRGRASKKTKQKKMPTVVSQ